MKRLRDILEQSAADEGRNQVQRKRLDIPVNENAPVVSNSWKTTKSISVPKLDNYQAAPEAETSKNSFIDNIKSFFGYDPERQTKIDAFKKKWRAGDLTDREAEFFMKHQRPDPDLKSKQEPPITIVNGKIQDRVPKSEIKVDKPTQVTFTPPMPAADGTSRITPNDNVDFTGSRYDLGNGQTVDPSKVTNKINPPIIVTPDKPLVTSKPNSALTAAGYDQSGKKITTIPKPKLKPERPSDVIPSGPGITTPGSMIYIEPKRQKLQDRVPQQKIQDRVPQQKIQDRVPTSAVNPKPTSAGPYAPAQSDDPFHQRYAKTASYLGQVPRDRKPPEKQKPIQNLYQINRGDTLEKIARKIGGENWQQTLKGIREKNPNIKERALKIGSELLLPEAAKPITDRIKQDQTYVPQSAINPPSSAAGPFNTGVSGAPKNVYNYKVPGLLNKNITVATKQQEQPPSIIPKPKLRPRISDDEAFIAAVRDQESSNDPKAISPAGAAGLMQVMPKTGAEIAKELDDVKYPKGTKAQQKYLQNPEVSDLYGRHYLNKLYFQAGKDIGFNDEEKLRKATLAAYNAGFGGSRKYRESLKAGKENPKLLPKETRNYVPSILSKYEKNKVAKDTSTQKTPETNSDAAVYVQVLPGQNATTIAKKHKLSLDQLEKFNPGISNKSNKGKLMPGDKIKIK